MSKIILLNGASSSGKTSIARAIQLRSQDPWLCLGVDTLIDMMPAQYRPLGSKAEAGLDFLPGDNENGPTMHVHTGPWGQQVFACLPLLSQLLVQQGNNTIIDEVLLNRQDLQRYVSHLHTYPVYFIGVFCDLPVMQEREILRHDRPIGLANDQARRVHAEDHTYDLKVNTTHATPFELADTILSFVQTHPEPKGFLSYK